MRIIFRTIVLINLKVELSQLSKVNYKLVESFLYKQIQLGEKWLKT